MNSNTKEKLDGILNKVRAYVNVIGKRLNPVLIYLLKAAAFFLAIRSITTMACCPAEGLLAKTVIHLGLSLVLALIPMRFGTFIVLALGCYLMVKASLFGGLVMSIFVMIVFIVTVCFTPEYAFLLLLVPIFVGKGIYLLVPLFAGIYGGPMTLVALLMGVFLWQLWEFAPVVLQYESSALVGGGITDILGNLPGMLVDVVKEVLKNVLENYQVLLLGLIFMAVAFLVWLLMKLRISYVHYVAIGIAGLAGMIALFVCKAKFGLDASVIAILFYSLLAMALAMLVRFLDVPLDYKHVRSISFSDDEYFYQVRLTPLANAYQEEEAKLLARSKQREEKKAKTCGLMPPEDDFFDDSDVKEAPAPKKGAEAPATDFTGDTIVVDEKASEEIRKAAAKADEKAAKKAKAEKPAKEKPAMENPFKALASKVKKTAEKADAELTEDAAQAAEKAETAANEFESDVIELGQSVTEEAAKTKSAVRKAADKAGDNISDFFD